MKARDGIRFAARPFYIVGRAAAQCSEEQRLSEAADVNHDGMIRRGGGIAQTAAQIPGFVLAELVEGEGAFLQGDPGQIVSGHIPFSYSHFRRRTRKLRHCQIQILTILF